MELQQMIMDFFQLLDLKPVEIRKGIWQVQVSDQLAKELDGWRAKGGLFQFTFDRKLADAYGAELISAGSYRLDTILQTIQKRATISQATLAMDTFYEPNIRQKLIDKLTVHNPSSRFYLLNQAASYSPYLWVSLKVSYLSFEKKEHIRKPLVDLHSGRVVNYEIPLGFLIPGAPNGPTLRKRLSYKQAYQRIQDKLSEDFQLEDRQWIKEALAQLEQERTRIEEFYRESLEQETKDKRCLELIDRIKPRIQVRPIRAAFLYLPRFSYRFIQVNQGESVVKVDYDPVSGQWEVC